MPITRKQFNLGIDSTIEQLMKRIHAYLSEHKDEAFTETELVATLLGEEPHGLVTWDASSEYQSKKVALYAALEKLVEVSAADEKEIGNLTYYSVGLAPFSL